MIRTLLVVATTLCAALTAHAQSVGPNLGDPKKCVVVVDDMGDVGFRISDAQVVADAVVSGLRKRVGFDAVTYGGVAASASAMKKLLATPEGAGPQDAQLKWFKECEAAAPWRVRARFGSAKGKQWASVSCRKAAADPKKGPFDDDKKFEGKTFAEARDALAAAMPAFCVALAPAASPPAASTTTSNKGGVVGAGDIPIESSAPPADAGPVGMHKKEPPKPWTPPPRRD